MFHTVHNNLQIGVLSELKNIFLNQPGGRSTESLSYNWGPGGAGETNRMARELGMPYTREEEDWLAVQVKVFSRKFFHALLRNMKNLKNYPKTDFNFILLPTEKSVTYFKYVPGLKKKYYDIKNL